MGVVDWIFSMPMFWVLALISAGGLLFVAVYYLVSLTDLESDLQNPIDMCRRANAVVLPEIAAHAVLVLLFLLTGSSLEFAVNLPLLIWNVKNVVEHKHLFDATKIFQDLPWHKKVNFAKLAFFMLCFFLYLFRLVTSLVSLTGKGRKRYSGTQ